MKILWLTHFLPYPPTGHGALQRTHHLLMRAASSHDVGLIALAPGATGPHDPLMEEARRGLAASLRFCDIHPLPHGPGRVRQKIAMLRGALGRRTFWEHWFYRPRVAAGLRRRMEEWAPDVVHLDSTVLTAYATAIPCERLVVTHHNVESDLYAQRAAAAPRLVRVVLGREARKLAELESRISRAAAMNVMVSETDARRLDVLAPGSRSTVVPNGVDTTFFSPDAGAPVRRKSLVFAGGMDWYANRLAMEWLVKELWPRLAADDAERTISVVGREPPPRLVAAAASDERITVTGFVDDVRPYLSASAIYVCPIHLGGGTRLKILDALSMRRPLVSTALGVSGLGLLEGTHYLRAETADEFVRQIGRLEQDPDLRAALGGNGRDFVEQHYAWSVVGPALDRAFALAVDAAARHAHLAPSPFAAPR